jgi:integrase
MARIRIKGIDFDTHLIFVRGGKGDKDRTTLLPEFVKMALQDHLKIIKILREKDLTEGRGEVYLPGALDKKYPFSGPIFVQRGPVLSKRGHRRASASI